MALSPAVLKEETDRITALVNAAVPDSSTAMEGRPQSTDLEKYFYAKESELRTALEHDGLDPKKDKQKIDAEIAAKMIPEKGKVISAYLEGAAGNADAVQPEAGPGGDIVNKGVEYGTSKLAEFLGPLGGIATILINALLKVPILGDLLATGGKMVSSAFGMLQGKKFMGPAEAWNEVQKSKILNGGIAGLSKLQITMTQDQLNATPPPPPPPPPPDTTPKWIGDPVALSLSDNVTDLKAFLGQKITQAGPNTPAGLNLNALKALASDTSLPKDANDKFLLVKTGDDTYAVVTVKVNNGSLTPVSIAQADGSTLTKTTPTNPQPITMAEVTSVPLDQAKIMTGTVNSTKAPNGAKGALMDDIGALESSNPAKAKELEPLFSPVMKGLVNKDFSLPSGADSHILVMLPGPPAQAAIVSGTLKGEDFTPTDMTRFTSDGQPVTVHLPEGTSSFKITKDSTITSTVTAVPASSSAPPKSTLTPSPDTDLDPPAPSSKLSQNLIDEVTYYAKVRFTDLDTGVPDQTKVDEFVKRYKAMIVAANISKEDQDKRALEIADKIKAIKADIADAGKAATIVLDPNDTTSEKTTHTQSNAMLKAIKEAVGFINGIELIKPATDKGTDADALAGFLKPSVTPPTDKTINATGIKNAATNLG